MEQIFNDNDLVPIKNKECTKDEHLFHRPHKRDKFYKLKCTIHEFFCKVRFLFQPFYTIGFSLVCMMILNLVLIVPMIYFKDHETIYNILFALVTGVTASFGVSVCIECSNNYRFNSRRSLEMMEYYSLFWSYELDKGIGMQKQGFCSHTDEVLWEPLDDIQVLWEEYLRELSRMEFDQALDTLVDKIFVSTSMMKVALGDDVSVGRQFFEKDEDEYSDSYMMSMFLQRMLEEIEELEKEALKQPVAGYLLKDMKRKNAMGKREKNLCNS